jgi:hypothetical protein
LKRSNSRNHTGYWACRMSQKTRTENNKDY